MNLIKLRTNKNKTQKEIAEYLGIKHPSYLSYEKGQTEPNIKNLIKLADFYQVSIDYLVGREWNNDIGYLTPEEKEIVQMIKQLNETNKIKLMGYLSAMISMQ